MPFSCGGSGGKGCHQVAAAEEPLCRFSDRQRETDRRSRNILSTGPSTGLRPVQRISIGDDCPALTGTLYLAHTRGGLAFLILLDRELDLVPFGQTAEPLRDDGRMMDKHVLSRGPGDEAVSLLVVKQLDRPGFASVLPSLLKKEKMPTPRRRR